LSGGSETIFGPGAALGMIVSGGVAYDLGQASGTVISAGGGEVVAAGGVAAGSIVSSGGIEHVHGVTVGDVIKSGGKEILSAGQASATTVSNGGLLWVSSAGVALGTVVRSGGQEVVYFSGSASGTVLSGGIEYDYGQASGTVIRDVGHEVVASGAAASGSVISGGTEHVQAGGVAAATIVSGGTLLVFAGGSVTGGITLHGGRAIISGTMAAGQTVSFVGTLGTLALDNLAGFAAAISGFGGASERIDLGGFAFGSGETATWSQANNTLTVHDGAKSASLSLIGTYATSDFQLSHDGQGGTFIRAAGASPGAVPATTRFAQAAAGLAGVRAGAATIQTGGNALLGASPLVAIATSGR